MMKRTCALVALLALHGCTTMTTAPRPDVYFENTVRQLPEAPLFSGDQAILSDDAIRRILDYQYRPPPLSRIAILPHGRELWFGWSEEVTQAGADLERNFAQRLRSSPRVYDASFLPSLLVPQERTAPFLREAAARYQADLLLVYRSQCGSFSKFRFFRGDRVRSYCAVEAVLLDTRTGLVPFTSLATRIYDTAEDSGDLNFREAVLRSQMTAIGEALAEISADLLQFLDDSGERGDAD